MLFNLCVTFVTPLACPASKKPYHTLPGTIINYLLIEINLVYVNAIKFGVTLVTIHAAYLTHDRVTFVTILGLLFITDTYRYAAYKDTTELNPRTDPIYTTSLPK